MKFSFISARLALVLWRPAACGSILRLSTVFSNIGNWARKVDQKERYVSF